MPAEGCAPRKVSVGGQAVMEGVMMRSPYKYAVAVRKADGTIKVMEKDFISLAKRKKFFGLPLVRGGVALIESLVIGMKALNFSADEAIKQDEKKKKENALGGILMAVTMVLGLAAGVGIFFYLPLFVTEGLGIKGGTAFNIVDGGLRLVIFVLYLWGIGRWKEIRRVFEYHGAEHKSIFAWESEGELSPEAAVKYPRLHPRCGTSFLLFVMVISILCFMILGKPDSTLDRVIRFLFIPVIGGIAYEVMKLSDRIRNENVGKILLWPGLKLQGLTTKEPSRDQIDVAIAALRAVIS
ncbi:MAG: DUF1385 domain-containing protein [Candidatus Eisenbacteria bacterium]|nr:DUF1385 domain-containing protein [Candidatus Eisenbacteria bacterium]